MSDWEKESNHELGKRDHASLYCSRSYKICTKVKVRIEVDYIASSTDKALKSFPTAVLCLAEQNDSGTQAKSRMQYQHN